MVLHSGADSGFFMPSLLSSFPLFAPWLVIVGILSHSQKGNSKMKHIIILTCLLPVLIFLNFLDIYTTHFALSNCSNLYELNALYYNLHFETVKMFVPFIVFGLYVFICRVCPFVVVRKTCVYSFFGLVVFSFCVITNNVFWIYNTY